MVNAHTHAAMIAFRGLAEDISLGEWPKDYIWPWEKKIVTPKFVYQNTKKAIRQMKKNGIRVFNDMYFFEDEVAKAAEEEKVYAVIGEVILDFPTPSAKTSTQALDYTERLIKKYKGSHYIRVAVAPHSIYGLSEKCLIEAKRLARKYGALYHIHLSETEDEYDKCLLKHGTTPVGYLDRLGLLDEKTILVHCVWLSQDDLELIVKRRAKIVHCPLSNLKLGSGIAPVAKYLRGGAKVCLGTDGAASSNRLDIWEAGKWAVLLQKGVTHDPSWVTAKDGVEMMTVNGMEALGLEEIDHWTIPKLREAIAKEKIFNYLYELNVEDLNFF